jgi:hypothetical protein
VDNSGELFAAGRSLLGIIRCKPAKMRRAV